MKTPRVEIRRHSPCEPWTYPDLDRRQREIACKVRSGEPGRLLVSEVARTITQGRRARDTDLLFSPEQISQKGIQIFSTDRGGLSTYHGPGQWILFPVDRLEVLTGDPRGVRRVVEALLHFALGVAVHYHPSAHIRNGDETGVWSSKGKLASIGVHIEEGVLLHGLAINGFSTPESFYGIKPCGLDRPVDFLLNSSNEKDFLELRDRLIETALKRLWASTTEQYRLH